MAPSRAHLVYKLINNQYQCREVEGRGESGEGRGERGDERGEGERGDTSSRVVRPTE